MACRRAWGEDGEGGEGGEGDEGGEGGEDGRGLKAEPAYSLCHTGLLRLPHMVAASHQGYQ